MMIQVLKNKVALVAGAIRGAGRGIAIELGVAGATVYCTGRTTRTQRSEYNRPETIEETADLVRQVGGEGIAVQVDHLDQMQVQALPEILRLYAQPALDNGRVLSITEAECIFDRMVSYNGWLHDFRANSHGFGLMIRGAICVTVNSQAGLLTTRPRADPRYG